MTSSDVFEYRMFKANNLRNMSHAKGGATSNHLSSHN